MARRGHAEILAQGVGHNRIVRQFLRQFTLVRRQQEQAAGREAARFQQSHNLYAAGRFAMKGYARLSDHLANERTERAGRHGEMAALHELQEALDDGVHDKVSLGVEHLVHIGCRGSLGGGLG